jgi:hypothetical protein
MVMDIDDFFPVFALMALAIFYVPAAGMLTSRIGGQASLRRRIEETPRALPANPSIIGGPGGIIHGRTASRFPPFLDTVVRRSSYVTRPLTRLYISGVFTFKGLRDHGRWSLIACGFKLVARPAAA